MKKFFITLTHLCFASLLSLSAVEPAEITPVSSEESGFSVIREITLDASVPTATPRADNATYTDWVRIGTVSTPLLDAEFVEYFYLSGVTLSKRINTANTDLVQYCLEGVFGGINLIIDANAVTHECSIAPQLSNWAIDKEMYPDAYETYYHIKSLGKGWFSEAGGSFFFSGGLMRAYSTDDSGALDRGAYLGSYYIRYDDKPEYKISCTHKPVYTSDDTEAVLKITGPAGARYRYKIYKNTEPASVATMFDDRYDGPRSTDGGEIRFPLDNAGLYNVYIVAESAGGEWLGYRFDVFLGGGLEAKVYSNRKDDRTWVDYGSCIFSVTPEMLNADGLPSPMSYERKVLTPADAKGTILRVVNPYGADTPFGKYVAEHEGLSVKPAAADTYYYDINITDPDRVYAITRPLGLVLTQPLSSLYSNDRMYAVGSNSSVYSLLAEGMPADQIPEDYFGKYRWNHVIMSTATAAPGNMLPDIILNPDMSWEENTHFVGDAAHVSVSGNVAEVRYAYSQTTDINDIIAVADKIRSGASDISIYTAAVAQSSRSDSRHTLELESKPEAVDGTAVVAVSYDYNGQCTGKFIYAAITEWEYLGKATIEVDHDYVNIVDNFRFTEKTDIEKCNSDIFRIKTGSEYLYIIATDPTFVLLSGDKNDVSATFDVSSYSLTNAYNYGITDFKATREGDKFIFPDYACVYSDNNAGKVYYMKGFTITLPEKVGIDDIEVDGTEDSDSDAPAEYFNLQGMRVKNPAHGIYIVRRGSKVSKVLIK